ARLEMVGDAQHVAGEVLVELQRTVVVLGVAVATRVPRGRFEAAREELDLAIPVAPVAADAMQQENERSLAGDGDGKARGRPDVDRLQATPPSLRKSSPRGRGSRCPCG